MGATGLANGGSTEYLTAYSNSTSYYYAGQNTSYPTFESFEEAGLKVSIIGDGIKEVWVSTSRAWFYDYSDFVYSTYPFFGRGGICSYSSDAGVFYSVNIPGARNISYSFRACMTKHMITFTIDGTTYQAEEGMTWAEWVESPYNVGQDFVINRVKCCLAKLYHPSSSWGERLELY